jgi:hypothetical protein
MIGICGERRHRFEIGNRIGAFSNGLLCHFPEIPDRGGQGGEPAIA